ncbi:hypothetical protein HDU76_007606, partial [Blyttiomyces sp. JEL0837]
MQVSEQPRSSLGLIMIKIAMITFISSSQALVLPQSAPANSTVNLPNTCFAPVRETCDFYSQCLNVAHDCGPQGYAIGYGDHFCHEFAARAPVFSPKAKTWMWNVMYCLQTALIPTLTTPNMTCQSIHDFALKTHLGCYVDNGLCDLSPLDWIAIAGTIGVKELLQPDSLSFEIQAGADCVKEYIGILKNL